jgi:hypothetical protein
MFETGEARFSLFSGATGTTANQLIYDDRPDSPFYRVFAIKDGYLCVQTAADMKPCLADYISLWRKLGVGSPTFLTHLHVPMAYPLGPDSSIVEGTRSALRALGVALCGRLAEWRYIDLHEVDWKAIRDAAEHP